MGQKNKKAGLSLEECRRNLLDEIQNKAGNKVIEKTIYFKNNDVPTFLKRLKEFEQKSRKVVITIR